MAPLALVTGASSGIGRACAVHLAGLGYVVGREARVQAVLARVPPDRALDALVLRAYLRR